MAYTTGYPTLPGLRAGADLSGKQFHFGKLASTAGQVVASGALNSTSVGTSIFGVIMNKPRSGEEVEFAPKGVVKVVAGTGTIAVGDLIGINSTSEATKVTIADNAAYVGRALEASSAPGDIITISLEGGRRF